MNARTLAITRAVAVIGGTGALIAAATFAFTGNSNTVSLSGTTLGVSQTTDVLRIFDFTGVNTGSWSPTSAVHPLNGGNAITLNLAQGVESPKQEFFLQNTDSSTTLSLSVMAAGATGTLDPTKVDVRFYDDAASQHQVGETTLDQLETVGLPLDTTNGTLPPNAAGSSTVAHTPGNFYVSFELTGSASGTDTLNGLNLQFTGTAL
jgi:hypothetical protein